MPDSAPQLPGSVCVAAHDLLLDHLGAFLLHQALKAVERRGIFHLALSGGTTPEPLYRRLMIDPRFRDLPWEQTALWQVDERRVPADDPRSNFGMIRELIVAHAPVRQRNVHPMPVLAPDPAAEYAEEFRRAFAVGDHALRDGDVPRLDLVMLGMGPDGHTASLFPQSPALVEDKRWVALNTGPHVVPPDRLTMTFPLLNAARQVAVLVTGSGKQTILRQVAQQLAAAGPDPARLPITGINPADGELTWWVDDQAV